MEVCEEVAVYLEKWFGKAEIERILCTCVTPPSSTTIRVKRSKDQLDWSINDLDNDIKNLLTKEEMVEWKVEQIPAIPDVIILRPQPTVNETCQQLYPRISVDQFAASAIMRGADLMAVGVIGLDYGSENNDGQRIGNVKLGAKVSIVVDVKRSLIRGQNMSLPDSPFPTNAPFIANGIVVMSRKEIFNSKSGSGVAVQITERIYPSVALHEIISHSNHLFLQNLPSTIASHVLQVSSECWLPHNLLNSFQPEPGQKIYDMCSAPGGKTTHIAQLMNDTGTIIATERSKSKIKSIQNLCDRLQLQSITVLPMDSTKVLKQTKEAIKQIFLLKSFDKILLDPPCSGLGLRPRYRDSNTVDQLKQHAEYQKKFFYSAVPLLKNGGELVYSTCTMHPEENEGNVAWALSTFPTLKLLPIPSAFRLGSPGLPDCGLSDDQRAMVQRFSPCGHLDSNAFFIAKFVNILE